jgi:putative transposase
MARPLQMDYPATFYHVLSRGNERKEIFYDEKDYLKSLDILGERVGHFKLEVRAYGWETGDGSQITSHK